MGAICLARSNQTWQKREKGRGEGEREGKAQFQSTTVIIWPVPPDCLPVPPPGHTQQQQIRPWTSSFLVWFSSSLVAHG